MEEKIFANGTKAIPTGLEDCYIIDPHVFGDNRGYFVPYFLQEYMRELGFERVVQTNRSKSSRGVLRGLHFQMEPYAQAKIVEVINGAAVDVVVDMREGSPTYGKSTSVLLTPFDPSDPTSGKQLFVPRGFAHGFVSLKDDTIFQYLIDNDYAPQYEGGIYWNDDGLDINWEQIFRKYNLSASDIELSEKDQCRPELKNSPTYFEYKKKVLTPKEYSFEDGMQIINIIK